MKMMLAIFAILLMACQQQVVKSPKAIISDTIVEPMQEVKEDFLTLDYVTGKFNPAKHKDFVVIPKSYADREGMYLRQEVFDAFVKMNEAAKKDGVHFVIRSAARNFDYQKGIWERKWTGKTVLSDGTNVKKDIHSAKAKSLKILEYSSMPGSSRHHWGTDFDLNNFNNDWFEVGEGLKMYNWLVANAKDYGFAQPYSPKGNERPEGYNEEKWHWSYLPTANKLTEFAKKELKSHMIKGFLGDETAEEIDIVKNYVLGIHSSCK